MLAEDRAAVRGATIDVRNPVTRQIVGSVPRGTPDEVASALQHLRAYRHGVGGPERTAILRRAAATLAERSEEFARRITDEIGTCLLESSREVERACSNLTVAADETERIHGEALRITASSGAKVALTIHEPVGLVCAITPFNRPLNQVVVKVAPAIAANNAVAVKPSSLAPLSAIAIVDLLVECGWPSEAIDVVTGDSDTVGDALVASPLVDMVTFTGSVATGERIMARVGVKKVVLELGGNDALIVLPDADPEVAARLASAGAFASAGQSCRGVKRIVAVGRIADRLVPALVARAQLLRLGDIYDRRTEVGSLISEAAAIDVERRMQAAVVEGAELCFGGTRTGPLMVPAVLDKVQPTSELVAEETFGPVAPVIRVADVDEAVAVANGTRYGLQAGVVTRDVEAFLALAGRLRVGAVNLNEGPQFDSPHIPFGGVKQSGIGREGIRFAIREMSTVKTVVIPWASSPAEST